MLKRHKKRKQANIEQQWHKIVQNLSKSGTNFYPWTSSIIDWSILRKKYLRITISKQIL